jgi:hypothetical protein
MFEMVSEETTNAGHPFETETEARQAASRDEGRKKGG